ncbi:alpha/beta fold hydrolase [Synechococcus sp. CS-205]|nr:alpha/beta fold hydrolase [Synechococcus sp. CS-205]
MPLQAAEPMTYPPLVMVHGLWDSPRLFRRLEKLLAGARDPLLVPHLSHRLGATPLLHLAERLGQAIEARFGAEEPIDLLGFSMGGVIARCWLQLLGGEQRTRRFISVASPQQGTITAQPWPSFLLGGIADMKPGSPLLRQLNEDPQALAGVECLSFYTPTDQVVVPGWKAVLPFGPARPLPVWLHQNVLSAPASLKVLHRELLRP